MRTGTPDVIPHPTAQRLDGREVLLATVIALGAWTALLTEILSLLGQVNRIGLALGWGASFIGAGLAFGPKVLLGLRQLLGRGLPRPSRWLAIPLVYVLLLLVIAWVAPPNTNDSLQYHMSRVAHWAQQQTVQHYATPISRQLWMPPFAEIAVLQLYVLAASDRLVNLIQWGGMVISLVTVSLIATRLGAGRRGQALASVCAVTVPMAILQATSTQNDLVVAVWVAALAFYALKLHQGGLSLTEWVLAGLAAGLGVLTKGTYAGYAFPLLLWMAASAIRRHGWASAGRRALLGLVLVTLLNTGAWMRNTLAYGNPLGPEGAVAAHANEALGWRPTLSNLIRGSTLHLATPYGDVNGPIRDGVSAIHRLLGMDVNDPRTTLGEYRVKRSFHEDYAGNPFHYVLFLACITALLASPTDGSQRAYALALVGLIVGFSALYKWQPTGSRLQLALFVAAAPLAGLALERVMYAARHRAYAFAGAATMLLLILTSLRPLLVNPSRPLLPRPEDRLSLWNTSRDEMLFVNTPELMPGYLPLIEAARGRGCSTIGLKIDSSHPEYPFWALLATPRSGLRLHHIEIPPPAGGYDPQGEPCAILCTYCTESTLQGMPLLFNHRGTYSLYVGSSLIP